MQGHQVEVVTLDSPSEPWVKDFPLPLHATGPSYAKYGYTPRLVPWLKQHHQDYDVVIINGLWQYNSFGVWQALRGTATPYCVFTHGMLDPWFKQHYPLKHLKKWLYWPWGDYRVLRDALAVMFTTEEERRLARRSFWLYRCDEVVVSYGIKAPADEPEQRKAFLNKHPELEGKRLLLYLSRIHEKKGCDLLLHAFARLNRQPETLAALADVRLIIAGPAGDEYGREMKALAQQLGIDHLVIWPGMITGDEKWGAFRCAEAFVLPSHQENFGIAVAEALACGVPVLISNRVNIWREVRLHEAGLVEQDDLRGTERLLKRWLALSPSEKEAMGRCARSCFTKCFDLAQFASSFIESLRLLGLRA
jgi:glycosyltransferase involved in cell wall biosynthesis